MPPVLPQDENTTKLPSSSTGNLVPGKRGRISALPTPVGRLIRSVTLWRSRHRFLFILVSLVLLIVCYPYFDPDVIMDFQVAVALTVVVCITAVYAVSDSLKKFLAVATLALILFGTGILTIIYPTLVPITVIFGVLIIFLVTTFAFILRSVLFPEIVSADTIYGAIAVYLLIGTTGASACYLVYLVDPSSFYFVPNYNIDGMVTFTDFLYYSLATLTTLGYGDIIPITPLARTVSVFIAMTGILYVAVLVADIMAAYQQFHPRLRRR